MACGSAATIGLYVPAPNAAMYFGSLKINKNEWPILNILFYLTMEMENILL